MKTQAIIVANDPAYLNWLQSAAADVEFTQVRPMAAEDLAGHVRSLPQADIVFFEFAADGVAQRVQLVEHFLDRLPDLPVAGIGADNNPDVVLAAMRAGARDFFVLRRDDANVAALLGKLLRRTTQAAAAGAAGQKQGKLFAVMSGNPTATIAYTAEHVALACVEHLKHGADRVLLLDVAGPAGAAAIFLNLNQTYGVLDAIHDAYRCDQTLVDTAFPKHASGLYVLSLPEDMIGTPQIDTDELLKLLQVLRGLFRIIVVSFDGHLPLPGMTGIIAQADRTLLLTDQSIIKSRHNKYLLRALRLEECPLDRTALLVNGYHRRQGLEPQNLAEILDLPLFGTLSGERMNHIQAMNSGEPMFTVAPRDPYCSEVRALAAALVSDKNQTEPAQQGLLSRLLS
ncbi:MAG: AAA family ATPase [Stenotrophobium sp.]